MSSLNDADPWQLWRRRLRERLREGSEPVFASGHHLCPAASLWVMMRNDIERLREQSAFNTILPATASIPGLASVLAALWLGHQLTIQSHIPGSVTVLPAKDLIAALPEGSRDTVYIDHEWGDQFILSRQLLPAIFSAEIIRLGPCHADVEAALSS